MDAMTRYTSQQFDQLPRPTCPVCGTTADVEKVYAVLNEADFLANGDSYIPGAWTCPRGCNPETGERLHANHNFEWDGDGHTFRCSCGHVESFTRADYQRLMSEHPLGAYS